jgi:hypothetical protein
MQDVPCSQVIYFIKERSMFIKKSLSAVLGSVLVFGCATLASAADDSSKSLSDTVSSLERTALPSLIASQDYWTASKVYFQVAVARRQLNETGAACAALSQSLEYYRAALVKDNLSVAEFGEMASDGSDEGDGMQEVRAKFGCSATLAASATR